ncbi:TatD family hydrolase [Halobaculum sp. CBA1158]|uniref:TatD family hydrolase n=1 Tax=Halobaculum sp. CBA1158 TaxID=2904243 RepID=UPI001F26F786|nr:TatD family hydrolase [Halobaculum sp. CBA1158]UIP01148.1 TatD family hydrolase [Halobaculum sp. CBA1158]
MSEDLGTPVLDDHLHLDPEHGRGMDAVDDFARLGGTHLIVVNKPSWLLGPIPSEREDFRRAFEATLDAVAAASERLRGTAWAVLGVHPGLVSRLVDDEGYDPEEARSLMCDGIDVAAEYVAEGRALGLKSGRPHYEVSDAVWNASNAVMRRAFEHGAELDCPVQLHTEASEDLSEIATWAAEAGMDPKRVVKHYAAGRLAGPTPSVMSEKDRLRRAAESGAPFLMETDFVDDPEKPGMVMGPKTVPRRVRWLLEEGYDEAVRTAHVETPRAVYEIDTEATLADAE